MDASLKSEIYARVKQFNYVTFAELMSVEGFKGNMVMTAGQGRNTVLWQGISEEALAAVKALMAEDKIVMMPPSSITVYAIDGMTLNLPIAKKWSKPYKKPHWYPVLLALPGSKNELVKL